MEGDERTAHEHVKALSQKDLVALATNVGVLFDGLPKKAWLKQHLVEKLLHGDLSRDGASVISGLC